MNPGPHDESKQPTKATGPPTGTLEDHTCLMSSSWRILILSLSIWILWSRSFCCCCCWVVSALGTLMSPEGGFGVGWFWALRLPGTTCCWCWWFITTGGRTQKSMTRAYDSYHKGTIRMLRALEYRLWIPFKYFTVKSLLFKNYGLNSIHQGTSPSCTTNSCLSGLLKILFHVSYV